MTAVSVCPSAPHTPLESAESAAWRGRHLYAYPDAIAARHNKVAMGRSSAVYRCCRTERGCKCPNEQLYMLTLANLRYAARISPASACVAYAPVSKHSPHQQSSGAGRCTCNLHFAGLRDLLSTRHPASCTVLDHTPCSLSGDAHYCERPSNHCVSA